MNDRLFSPVSACQPQDRTLLLQVYPSCRHTSKLLRFLRRHCPQVLQIALVSHQHDDNVCISVISQLFQPPLNIFVRLMLADVIYQESADGTPVIGRCDGTVSLLARGVPDLSFDGFGVDLDGAGRKLDTNGRFAV